MRRQDRSSVIADVAIPASVLAASELAAEYLPPLILIADSELAKMGEAGKVELWRRDAVRQEHVKEGRAIYVYRSKGYGDSTFWCVSRMPKGQERDKDGRLIGNTAQSSSEGVRLAQMILAHEDKGGVIYRDDDWRDEDERIIDVRPSECQALKETGQHDWSYVPTGDDVCRSCGLVS